MGEELRLGKAQSEKIEKRSENLCLMPLLLRHGPQQLKCSKLLHDLGARLSSVSRPRDVSIL